MKEAVLQCPACGAESSQFSLYKKCLDYSVSHELFSIDACNSCGHLFTNPRPANAHIGSYYQSAAYISHSDTSQGFVNKLYKLARQATLLQKRSLVRKLSPEGKRLLDVGCGTGYFAEFCQRGGWMVEGVEPDPKARELAAQKIHGEVLQQIQEVAGNYRFDVITLWHVLEHMHDLSATFKKLCELVKPDGKVVIAVPNPEAYDATFYQHYWAAYDVPRHLHHFQPSVMQALARKFGFRVIRQRGMVLDSFYVSLLSERYRKGKLTLPSLLKAMEIGLKSNVKASQSSQYSSIIYVLEIV